MTDAFPSSASTTISPDDDLFRRLAPGQVTGDRVNSAAFSGRSDQPYEISVGLARLTTPERMLRTRPGFGLGVLRVEDVLALGFRVVHDPVEGDDAHCLIVGDYTKPDARRLAAITRIVRLPLPV